MKITLLSTPQIWFANVCAVAFCAAPARAQPHPEATNVLLKLTPPYGELPPTFLELHAPSLVFAGMAVAALAAFGLWRLFRAIPKTIRPPETQAREALLALRAQPEDGAVLSRVSQVLRHYFIAAFQLAGDELTTAEFNRELTRSEKISPALSAATTDFLRECDARKFSATTGSEKLDGANRALNLVEQAEQRRAQLRQLAKTQTPGPRA